MARIKKLRADFSLIIHIEDPPDIPALEGALHFIELRVAEKRILGDAKLSALGFHHVHRIVQHRAGQLCGLLGQENLRIFLPLRADREGAYMIEMGVSHDDGIRRIIANQIVARLGTQPLLLRMHPRV